jgi:hypothetical protein
VATACVQTRHGVPGRRHVAADIDMGSVRPRGEAARVLRAREGSGSPELLTTARPLQSHGEGVRAVQR